MNIIRKTSCMTRESSEEAPLPPWWSQLETTQTPSSTTGRREPRPKHKRELLQLKNSSLEMSEHQNHSKADKTSTFKPISLSRNSPTRHPATRSDARPRSRSRDLRLHVSCQERKVWTRRPLLRTMSCSSSMMRSNPSCLCSVERLWSSQEWRYLRRKSSER